MKKLLSIVLLTLIFGGGAVFAQNTAVVHQKQSLPITKINQNLLDFDIETKRKESSSSVKSVSCSDDLAYTNAKMSYTEGAAGWDLIQQASVNYWSAVKQKYEAPQNVSVSGVWFYGMGLVDDGTFSVVTNTVVTVSVEDAVGTVLASQNITVSAQAWYNPIFTTPATVNGDYYIVITSNDPTNLTAFTITDDATFSGMGEDLAQGNYAGVWYSYLTDLGSDIDIIMEPSVSYVLDASFTFDSPIFCHETTDLINTTTPIANHRMYNQNAFNAYFDGVADITTYVWDVNGTPYSTEDVMAVSFTSAGSHPVTLNVNMAGWYSACLDVEAASIVVDPLVPDVTIAITNGNNPTCPSGEITFTATPTNGGLTPTYEWFNGAVSVGTGVSYTGDTFTDGDQITVVMTSSEACVTTSTATSTAITVTVDPLLTLTPAVSITVDNNPFCAGSSVTFTATPINGGSTPSYAWYVNGIQDLSSTTNSFTASLTDLDEVYSVMTSSLACADPVLATSSTIIMNEIAVVVPTIVVTPSANPICAGAAVTFTAAVTNEGSTPTYQWDINGNATGTNSNVFVSSASGLVEGDVVSVMLTSSAVCASPVSETDSVTISVKPLIQGTWVANETAPGDVYFDATSITGAGVLTYSWDFGDGTALGSGVTTNHTYAVNDIYTVDLVVTDECGTVTISDDVDFLTLSINNPTAKSLITVYPNPSNGIFNVNIAENATVIVYNAIGTVINSSTTTNNKLTVDLSSQANGIYLFKVITDSEIVVKKVNISK